MAGAAAKTHKPVDCLACRGACCVSLIFKLPVNVRDVLPVIWFGVDGQERDGFWVAERPCSKLLDGRCGIYPDRPAVCRDLTPGADACLAALGLHRTPEQIAAILSG
jgi:Fe-S-cluster containining protein